MSAMTEAEAKTRWCPFSRGPNGQNRGNPEPTEAIGVYGPCIGSACMSWRLYEDAGFKATADAEYRKTGNRLENDMGFCGLAGRP